MRFRICYHNLVAFFLNIGENICASCQASADHQFSPKIIIQQGPVVQYRNYNNGMGVEYGHYRKNTVGSGKKFDLGTR